MKTFIIAILAGLAAAGCGSTESAALAVNQAAQAGTILQNSSFNEGSGEKIPGWEMMGDKFARAELVRTPNVSPPFALKMTPIGKGSGGSDSFMIFQTLDHNRYRGQRLRFGARVRTQGAGVNIALYTPERSANEFEKKYERHGVFAPRGCAGSALERFLSLVRNPDIRSCRLDSLGGRRVRNAGKQGCGAGA